MFTLKIPTTPINRATGEDTTEGATLAQVLRQIADKIDTEIQIVPTDTGEWTVETYRHATRINGVLIGATFTLVDDSADA